MHRREHVAVIRAGDRGILMHTMFYANEVRKEQEFTADPAIVADKELDLAIKLIEALATEFEPEKFRDRYREQVEALIAAKIQGREVPSAQAQQRDPPRCGHNGGPEEEPRRSPQAAGTGGGNNSRVQTGTAHE